MKLHIIILLCIIISFTPSVLLYADVVTDTKQWVKDNPGASPNEIKTFFDKKITQSQTVNDTYEIIKTLLNIYPTQIIPSDIYLHYAKTAELKFDFEIAAKAYEIVYKKTQNYKYLLRSAINYFEIGEKKLAYTFLEQIEKNNPPPETMLLLTTVKANILLQDNKKKQALSLLQKARFAYPKEKFSSAFFYSLYFVAEQLREFTISSEAQQILTQNFPYSLEVYLLNSARVHPLPLPSRVLTLGSQILSNLNNSVNAIPFQKEYAQKVEEQQKKEKSTQIPIPRISPPPLLGYQVGSFTKKENAYSAYTQFYNIWNNITVPVEAPIIAQKNISGTVFYQIIFPIPPNAQSIDEVTNILRTENLEGFVVQQK